MLNTTCNYHVKSFRNGLKQYKGETKLRTKGIESFVTPEDWLDDDRLELLTGWARDGYTYADVAKRIGISVPQLTKWRKEYPEIAEALKKGREVVDYKVESALLKSALGYKTKEVTIITVIQNGQTVETTKQTVTREVAPNVQACQVWLYNRLPNKWKNMNARSNIIDDLNDNQDISITITRAGKSKTVNENESDSEWQDSVNDSVKLQGNKEKKKRTKKKKTNSQVPDRDYWPDDWEDEDE